jgi:hypothetical protein
VAWCILQVKNVTGRLLVGLRWWNEGNSETGNAWRFESLAEVGRLQQQQEQQQQSMALALKATAIVWNKTRGSVGAYVSLSKSIGLLCSNAATAAAAWQNLATVCAAVCCNNKPCDSMCCRVAPPPTHMHASADS